MSLSGFSSASVASSSISLNQGGNEGGGFRVSGSARLSLTSTSVAFNSAMDGGAICAEMSGAVTIRSSTISNNTGTIQAGGLYLIHQSQASIHRSVLEGNSGLQGGAIVAAGDVKVTVSHGTVMKGNTPGAISLQGRVDATIVGSSFLGNTAGQAGDGGAIRTVDSATATIRASNFTSNTARRGGAIYCDAGSQLAVQPGTHFDSNQAAAEGGGIFVAGSTAVSVHLAAFTRNAAGTGGGGVALFDAAHGRVTNCSFRRNRAATEGAAMLIDRDLITDAGEGGGSFSAAALLALVSAGGSGAAADAGGSTPRGQQSSVDANSTSDSTSSGGGSPHNGTGSSILPLVVAHLQFSSNHAPASQGSAFFDASFDPRVRTSCEDCREARGSAGGADTAGSLPAHFTLT